MTGSALLAEQWLGDSLYLFAVAVGMHKSRRRGRQAARGNDNASLQRVLLDLLVGGNRQALDAGQDQHGIVNSKGVDGVAINQVEIETRVQNLRNHFVSQQLSHRFVDAQSFSASIEAA